MAARKLNGGIFWIQITIPPSSKLSTVFMTISREILFYSVLGTIGFLQSFLFWSEEVVGGAMKVSHWLPKLDCLIGPGILISRIKFVGITNSMLIRTVHRMQKSISKRKLAEGKIRSETISGQMSHSHVSLIFLQTILWWHEHLCSAHPLSSQVSSSFSKCLEEG